MTGSLPDYAIIQWQWGYLGLVCYDDVIVRLIIGGSSKVQCLGLITNEFPTAQPNPNLLKPFQQELIDYSHGHVRGFHCTVHLGWATPFGQKVLRECLKIQPGTLSTYQQLAINAKSPKAARAIGNVMATNRIPIVIPCHRVITTSGQLGGYSAIGGTAFKQKLINHEKIARKTS
ncbi:MAG: methylated-DNA--[protein]-cysteine S-methyltransferase [Phycisphaerae bacterium]|nr:methylated-DNA--[protein]-cysteine S-methyltransferase [Phycisphaerae bacterium]